MYKENIAEYDNFIRRLTGLPARINARTGKSMKLINEYLLKAVKDNTEEKVIEAWKLILDNYTSWDSFHQKQIELHQINGNLINIINSIKNSRVKSNSAQAISIEAQTTIEKLKSKYNGTNQISTGNN